MLLWKKKGHRETGGRFFFCTTPPGAEGLRKRGFVL